MLLTTFTTLSCAALMGLAIQRGGTCFVHAVYEILTEGHMRRLRAILEASLWVTGGLALGHVTGVAGITLASTPISVWSVVGGVLLGVGASINRACALGTVAQLGTGNWAYAMTPLGYYLGCLSASLLFPRVDLPIKVSGLALPVSAPWLVTAFLLYMLWRVGAPLQTALRQGSPTRVLLGELWSPHVATVTIGASFVVLLLVGGHWSYTDVLADFANAAHGQPVQADLPVGLLLMLFAGAVIGGLTSGKWNLTAPALGPAARCLIGGTVMAWGSGLIPGSNDRLLLIGIPLLQANAWIAMAAMALTVTAAISIQSGMQRRAGKLRETPGHGKLRDSH